MCLRFAALVAVLVAIGAPSSAADIILVRNTRHLSFTAAITPDTVKPGGRLTLAVKVTPKRRMHVYAPGTKYRAISVAIDKHPALKPSRLVYPKPSIYFFEPFKEHVLVYSDPFTLTMNVAVGTLRAGTTRLKISGRLSYQACDDRVCYLPESVPLEWNLAVK